MIYVTTIKPLNDHDHDHNDDERGDDGDDDDKIAMMTSESMIDHGKLVVCGLRPNGALQTVAMQIIILMTIMAGIIIIIMMTMTMMMS